MSDPEECLYQKQNNNNNKNSQEGTAAIKQIQTRATPKASCPNFYLPTTKQVHPRGNITRQTAHSHRRETSDQPTKIAEENTILAKTSKARWKTATMQVCRRIRGAVRRSVRRREPPVTQTGEAACRHPAETDREVTSHLVRNGITEAALPLLLRSLHNRDFRPAGL